MSLKKCEPPERSRSWPKKTKVMTIVALIFAPAFV